MCFPIDSIERPGAMSGRRAALLVLSLVLAAWSIGLASPAMAANAIDNATQPPSRQPAAKTEAHRDSGPVNSVCPVLTDEAIDPSIAPIEYNGMKIGFCCNRCRRQFAADPEKYVANLRLDSDSDSATTTAAAAVASSTAMDQAAPPRADVEEKTAPATGSESAGAESAGSDSAGEQDANDADHAAESHSLDEKSDDAGNDHSASQRFLAFVGKFHVLVIHFPIALLLTAALAEFVGLFSAAAFWRSAGWYCALLGAAGAVAAAVLGWIDAAFTRHPGMETVLEIHRWLGTSTAVVAVVAVLFHAAARSGKRPRFRVAYLVLLFLSALLVAVTGHFGGTLIYGLHYFSN